jgi:2,3-bisphosphoglycerate-independent phosphoglycerate mutase
MGKHKMIILLGDGMADIPHSRLENKSPLEYAHTPNMDRIAREGISGMAQTVPKGMAPGSDTANLAVFGYDPEKYYTGRAPLEAINMGITMEQGDAAFRCNTVSIVDETMDDFTAHHISTDDASEVISAINRELGDDTIEFIPGVSYRHLLIWRKYPHSGVPVTTPPHDITGQKIAGYLPQGTGSEELQELMDKARRVITSDSRFSALLSDIWLWGGGPRPDMEPLTERYNITGHTISAVNLIHGIGIAAGLTPLEVEGATGYLDTNYEAKTKACLNALKESDFIFLHVEAPDESGHEGNFEHKLQAIEDFDSKVVGPVMAGISQYDATVLVMPDHPTPLDIRTHTDNPVPFALYDSQETWNTIDKGRGARGYSEKDARETGLFIPRGYTLLDSLLRRKALVRN